MHNTAHECSIVLLCDTLHIHNGVGINLSCRFSIIPELLAGPEVRVEDEVNGQLEGGNGKLALLWVGVV